MDVVKIIGRLTDKLESNTRIYWSRKEEIIMTPARHRRWLRCNSRLLQLSIIALIVWVVFTTSFAFPLHSAILKPDFNLKKLLSFEIYDTKINLTISQVDLTGEFLPPIARQVLIIPKLLFQFKQLIAGIWNTFLSLWSWLWFWCLLLNYYFRSS